jgi:hypothetical protein
VDAPNPTRQVALVSKAGPGRNFGQPKLPVANKLGRALHSQIHDVMVWGQADRSCKHTREVERAAPGNARELGDLDGLVNVGDNVVSEPLEDRFAQHASRPGLDL